jgi:hypothetical protein
MMPGKTLLTLGLHGAVFWTGKGNASSDLRVLAKSANILRVLFV